MRNDNFFDNFICGILHHLPGFHLLLFATSRHTFSLPLMDGPFHITQSCDYCLFTPKLKFLEWFLPPKGTKRKKWAYHGTSLARFFPVRRPIMPDRLILERIEE